MTIRWQTLGIGREYRLFREKQIVGILKNNFWNRKGYGELHGFLMRFEKEKTGKGPTQILDIEGEKVLGTIDFGFFPSSAVIHHEGQRYQWKYPSKRYRGSWLVSGQEEEANYEATGFISSAGTITDTYLHPVVIMAGLYVQGYFIKRSFLVVMAVFLVGLLTLFFS
ncbi:MAG: hypothetical protein KKG00_07395 [Bacteroidetes bacterium]|nr:hypothetical protein [Bacteroidota bacterium]